MTSVRSESRTTGGHARLIFRPIAAGGRPRSRRGAMFKPGLRGILGDLNDDACPACGLVFLHEAGYFLGAMLLSSGRGVLTVLPVALALARASSGYTPTR